MPGKQSTIIKWQQVEAEVGETAEATVDWVVTEEVTVKWRLER